MRKTCEVCGGPFEAKRPAAKYCGERCKKRAQRRPGGVSAPRPEPVRSLPVDEADGPVTAATRTELTEAGREATAAGQVALAAARRIDRPVNDTGSSLASLMREYRAALAEAVQGAEQADELDELKKRRDAKRHAG